jgi:hypothetical protein
MQAVMDALGQREELAIASDHLPARVNACPARVGQERGEHLGHTAATGGGAHVPDSAPGEQRLGGVDAVPHLLEALWVQYRSEPFQ